LQAALKKISKRPERSCVGCGKRSLKAELLRFTISVGRLYLDCREQRASRGAYLCYDRSCLSAALKKRAFSRAFKSSVRLPQVCRADLDGQSESKVIEERFWQAILDGLSQMIKIKEVS